VERNTVSVLSGDRVRENCLDPINNVIFVVIVNHHLKVGMVASQHRAQVIAQEIAFFGGSEGAGLCKVYVIWPPGWYHQIRKNQSKMTFAAVNRTFASTYPKEQRIRARFE
jgi:hypothetical protein